MKENYETMVDNIEKSIFTGDFFQVTYYDVYSWERKPLKRQVYKKSYSTVKRTKPINDNDVNIQGIIKRTFHFEGKLIYLEFSAIVEIRKPGRQGSSRPCGQSFP